MGSQAKVIFWDVQHGHAAYILSPNNRHIVVDLGTGRYETGKAEFSPLLHLKKNYGVQQLDYVVITHPHKDHIDDIFNVDALKPKVLSRPNHLKKEEVMKGARAQDVPKYERYFEISDWYSGPVEPNNDPYNPDNYGGLAMREFGTKNCSTLNINNHSLVEVFSYAGSKVVIPGDNESCSFEELLEDQYFRIAVKDCDILLAPHHGRESGYHAEFVDLANPRLTVVSDGRFGDTSATSRYSDKSRGLTVHKRSGESKERFCLTTRQDGVIGVAFGYNNSGRSFLEVTIK